ncbi:MAG: lamin tail domain-containing protein [Candidatus Pacearchaeota archaeon]
MYLWKENCWCLVLIYVFIIFFASFVSANVIINEVMPHTNNSLGNEWIELYNPTNESINLTNWKINDTQGNDYINLTISNSSYALIVDDNVNFNGSYGCEAVYLLLNNSNISCFEVSEIGKYGLNDEGEGIFLYNETGDLISNFSWTTNIKSSGKSWSFNGTDWQTCIPTPGYENNCYFPQICVQNWSCSAWSNCTNGIQTRTCTDLNNCSNNTGKPYESQSCNNQNIYLEIDYEDEIKNGDEIEVEVKAYNLANVDYDIKVYITQEDNDKIISETYNEEEEKWKSSTYYVNKIISGSGNKTVTLKMRIDEDYSDFYGDAKIYARIRKNGESSIIDDVSGDIKILKKDETQKTSTTQNKNSATTQENQKTNQNNQNSLNSSTINSNVIKLNSKQTNSTQQDIKTSSNKILYKSKIEYFKDYGIYVFAGICIIIIFILLKRD